MCARKRPGRRSYPGLIRALWLVVVALAFCGSALVLTCQRGPSTGHRQSVASRTTPQRPVTSDRTTAVPDSAPPVQEADQEPEDLASSSEDTSPTETPETGRPDRTASAPVRTPLPADLPGEVSRGDAGSPRIALTFDAGADSKPTTAILAILKKHHLHATFFLTGAWMRKNPALTREIAAQGHEIGNHTYSHKRLTTLDEREIAEEVDRTEQLVLELTGRSTKPLLRVPYGARDKRVLSILGQYGYRSIYWTVDSWDSVKADITADEIQQRVLSKTTNGSIVLMHCGSRATADALDTLVSALLDSGYQPVTVSGLLDR